MHDNPRALRPHAVIAAAAAACVLWAAGTVATAGAEHRPTTHDTALSVTATDGERTRRATVRCVAGSRRVTGFLKGRDVKRLCGLIAGMRGVLVAPRPTDVSCTGVFGGPDRARVTGRLRGERVDRRFNRTDGCQISYWDAAQRILPRPTGER